MRTVLELTLLFTLALVSVSYATVRDELLYLKLQCHKFGYAKVTVNDLGAIASIKLKPPRKSRPKLISDPGQPYFVKTEPLMLPKMEH